MRFRLKRQKLKMLIFYLLIMKSFNNKIMEQQKLSDDKNLLIFFVGIKNETKIKVRVRVFFNNLNESSNTVLHVLE